MMLWHVAGRAADLAGGADTRPIVTDTNPARRKVVVCDRTATIGD